MTVKLLAEHHLEFLSSKGGCTGWSESTLVKMSHCCKSRVTAHNKRICSRETGAFTLLQTFKPHQSFDTSTKLAKEKSIERRGYCLLSDTFLFSARPIYEYR